MEAAEAQPVVGRVGATVRPPHDVSGIEADGAAVEPAVEFAERAAHLVGDQHLLSELPVACASLLHQGDGPVSGGGRLNCLEVDSGGERDVLVHGRRPAVVEQRACSE